MEVVAHEEGELAFHPFLDGYHIFLVKNPTSLASHNGLKTPYLALLRIIKVGDISFFYCGRPDGNRYDLQHKKRMESRPDITCQVRWVVFFTG